MAGGGVLWVFGESPGAVAGKFGQCCGWGGGRGRVSVSRFSKPLLVADGWRGPTTP